MEGITEQMNLAAFLPDSRRIFVQHVGAHPMRAPRLYDDSTGKEIRRFEKERGGPSSPQGVSPDGRRVLMVGVIPDKPGVPGRADRSVRLVDVETGKELHRFDGHTDAVTSAVFLPDGKFALTGSADNTMRLWRLPEPPAARVEAPNLPSLEVAARFHWDIRVV